jgi:hypothetical protein
MMAVGEDRWKERGGAYSFSYMGKERDEDRGDARIEVVHMHS